MNSILKFSFRALTILGASAVLCGPVFAGAGPPPSCPAVPEIDPASVAGAMTLLVGGVLTLADRRRAKVAS